MVREYSLFTFCLKKLYSPIYRYNKYKLKRKLKNYGRDKKGNVLEIGCGPISFKHCFPNCDVISTDIVNYENIDKIADARKLPFKDNSFDIVLCLSVIEHVYEYQDVIDEIHRVLKLNGELLISVPFFFPLHDEPNDFWRMSCYALRRLLSEKFEIIYGEAQRIGPILLGTTILCRKRKG